MAEPRILPMGSIMIVADVHYPENGRKEPGR